MARPRKGKVAVNKDRLRSVETRSLLAVALTGISLWGVAKLGSEIGEGETGAFDRAVFLAFRTPADPNLPIGPVWLRETARDLTALGGFTVLTLITVAAVAVLLVYRRYRQASVFAATVVIAQVIAETIKATVGRPRPVFVTQYDLVASTSFPSGHSMMAPAVYFTLATIIAAGELRPAARWLLMVGSIFIVAAVGVSRVYLGVHWPTDVIAGWSLGSAIALMAWVALGAGSDRSGSRELADRV